MRRLNWAERLTVEQCRILDIPFLKKTGYLDGFRLGSIEWKNRQGKVIGRIGIQSCVRPDVTKGNYIRLFYSLTNRRTGEKTEHDYNVKLTTSPCHFGGYRYWFLCPMVIDGRQCQKKASKLYLPSNADQFACRHCHDLTYSCQKYQYKKIAAILKNPSRLQEYGESKKLSDNLLALEAYYHLIDKS